MDFYGCICRFYSHACSVESPLVAQLVCSVPVSRNCKDKMFESGSRHECTGYIWDTSSTAQGGGGSFKDRKPVGAVCCCEALMAERTDGTKGG
jgi:hypothetical protein